MDSNKDKVAQLVAEARTVLHSAGEPDKAALWRAYVSIERAILDLKLRYRLEGQAPPPRLPRKAAIDISGARSMLERIDPSSEDKKILLYDLRACRDLLKALVASYERRSTTS
ncbi:MAG TPA: hypothetical protein VLA68_07215 [Nitrososphaera sp.]|nr:hypothetical protein [Nitrososphaera sp.]